MRRNSFVILMILIYFCGCSTRPKLLPNDKLLGSDKSAVEQDIDYCLDLADTYTDDSSRWKQGAANTAKASVIGTAAGAVGGAIVHSAGKGAAVGAASGAVAALLNELYEAGDPDPTYKQFAEYCLSKKGYEIAGW